MFCFTDLVLKSAICADTGQAVLQMLTARLARHKKRGITKLVTPAANWKGELLWETSPANYAVSLAGKKSVRLFWKIELFGPCPRAIHGQKSHGKQQEEEMLKEGPGSDQLAVK